MVKYLLLLLITGLAFSGIAIAEDLKNASEWLRDAKLLFQIYPHQNEYKALELEEKFFQLAQSSAKKSIELDNNQPEAWIIKGDILRWHQDFEEAQVSYDRALEINPLDYSSWEKKGEIFVDQKKEGDAIECYDRAICCCKYCQRANISHKRSPEALIWMKKGRVLSSLGRIDDALECYNNSIEIFNDPKELGVKTAADALIEKGIVYRKKGEYLYALEFFNESRNFSRGFENSELKARAWLNMGVTRLMMRDYHDSIECFNCSIESLNNDNFTENDKNAWAAWFGKATALALLNKGTDSDNAYDTAIEIAGGNPDLSVHGIKWRLGILKEYLSRGWNDVLGV